MLNKKNIKELSYFTINQSNEPLLWIDKEGTVQHINPAVESLLGYSSCEIIGKKIYEFHPDENTGTWKEAWKNLKVNKKHVFEKKQPAKSG